MNKRILVLIILIIILLLWIQPLDLGKKEVFIPKGTNANQIAEILANNHIVRDKNEFLFWLKLFSKEKSLKFGTYELSRYKNPLYLIHKLSAGSKAEIIVTVPEGLTLDETTDLLETKGLVAKHDFISLCADKNFIKGLGLNVLTLEGYLFPDSYFFSEAESDSKIVKTFVKNFQNHIMKFGVVDPDTIHKILIIASLVEKEAKYDDERPLIASVFLNRLKTHRPLESCATVIYAFKISGENLKGRFSRLTEKDLQIASPYNTYLHVGLPPGPICSPGENSIKAVISPAGVDYLYFVSIGNGRHYFSKTYKEHLTAKERYRAQN